MYGILCRGGVYSLIKCRSEAFMLIRCCRNLGYVHKQKSVQQKQTKSKKSSPGPTSEDMCKIRNIGIMAHIDAGKTTTTERMLFYSGYMRHLGDVDHGDTVMDYMEQERARGITITSAAITFFWNKHRINLIDTPGHVDFTLEVERSLRVLDGAIAILDASAGVEAQTLTVWRQAETYKVPRIIFLNKMDKANADFKASIKSIEEKLHVTPLVTQLPLGQGNSFKGVINLVSMQKLLWDSMAEHGRKYEITPITPSDGEIYDEAHAGRTILIENLANIDDTIGEKFLDNVPPEEFSEDILKIALHTATMNQRSVPVLCGSSLKNKGVQPLMDAVIDYLPNPNEIRHQFLEYYQDEMCAMAFKITHDKQRGPLTFLRVYGGHVKAGDSIYNVNQDCTERVSRLLEVFADDHKDISQANSGNIVAVAGLRETITGDTLVSSSKAARTANKLAAKKDALIISVGRDHEDDADSADDEPVISGAVLASLKIPDPVFFCSIEPPSLAYQKALDHALSCLTREDPSLRCKTDPDTAQIVLSGMGELHLEIIQDRIHKEYGVEADLGPLQIAYRETIGGLARKDVVLDKVLGDKRQLVTVSLTVHQVSPESPAQNERGYSFKVMPDSEGHLTKAEPLSRFKMRLIENGVRSGLSKGPILSFPVQNVGVQLHDFHAKYGTSAAMVTAAVAQCLHEALKDASPRLLEPIMSLLIHTDENYVGKVLSDLSQRRSQIFDLQSAGDTRSVVAATPLAELRKYSTTLRTLTSGTSTFFMNLSHYESMTETEQRNAIVQITGFAPVDTR